MSDSINQEAFYSQVGARVRACRQLKRMSQETLADRVGLTRSSLSNIENGRQHTSLQTFFKIAQVLDTEFSSLLPEVSGKVSLEEALQRHAANRQERAFIESALAKRAV